MATVPYKRSCLSRIQTWDLSACLYLNLEHGNLDHLATTAGCDEMLCTILFGDSLNCRQMLDKSTNVITMLHLRWVRPNSRLWLILLFDYYRIRSRTVHTFFKFLNFTQCLLRRNWKNLFWGEALVVPGAEVGNQLHALT